MTNFIRYQLPLLVWALLIFWLSSLSTLPRIKTPVIPADKLAHISFYFVFCWFSRRALFFQNGSKFLKRWSLLIAFLVTCCYGYSDEFHQLFVPRRTFDYYDMLADAIGALIFVIVFIVANRLNDQQTRTS